MVNLEHAHPWLHQRFAIEGLCVVRHSERFWASLWPILLIEQIMIRVLTRGCGFTESLHILWIYSMRVTASCHNTLSYLTQTQHGTSDQYKELGQSRKLRDLYDFQNVITCFQYQGHNPFNPD